MEKMNDATADVVKLTSKQIFLPTLKYHIAKRGSSLQIFNVTSFVMVWK